MNKPTPAELGAISQDTLLLVAEAVRDAAMAALPDSSIVSPQLIADEIQRINVSAIVAQILAAPKNGLVVAATAKQPPLNMRMLAALKQFVADFEGCYADSEPAMVEARSVILAVENEMASGRDQGDQGEWFSPHTLPVVEVGKAVHCFVAIKNKRNGKVRVADAHYCNFPLQPQEDNSEDYPDWTLHDDTGAPISMVGWADRSDHPDFNGYYTPIDTDHQELIAWQLVQYPQAPASTPAATEDDKQQPVSAKPLFVPALPPYDCFSRDDGDSWEEHPASDCFVHGRKLGDEFELLAGWKAERVTFRVTKVPDGESDDYEVEQVTQPQPAGVPSSK